MTVSNWLSVARVVLIPVYVVLLLGGVSHGDQLAAAAFAVAAATDKLDGQVARARNEVTTLGIFIDSLADKLLVACAFIALVSLDRLAAWVAMVVIAREFAVTGFRLVAASSEVIAASWLGKWKAAAQMALIIVLTVAPHQRALDDALIALVVVLTLWSGADYFVRGRHHLMASVFEDSR